MKKAFLKNFAIFTGKLQACNFVKWAAASVLTLLLKLDNLLTGYKQLSYYNISIEICQFVFH